MIKKITKKNILVVVAHTDDETLGLGGTIARHSLMGDKVYGISMTDGLSSRVKVNKKKIKLREKASENAAKIIGLNWLKAANFPDNAIDTIPILKVIKIIEKAKTKIKPSLIYTHSSADLNIDHRIVSEATLVAFRPQTNEIWEEIRTFEVPSATDYGHKSVTNNFCPNLYINITETWKMKLNALKEYKMEMRKSPHSRSFDGLENLANIEAIK